MSAALRERIKALERRRARLRRHASELTETRDQLLLRSFVLTACFDGLNLLQAQVCSGDPLSPEQQLLQEAGATREFLQQELQLLQEFQTAQGLGDAPAATALPHPGVASLSPAGDPMAYFRHLVSLGPCEEVQQWTSRDLASLLRESTAQASLYLNQQELGAVQQSQVHIKDVWDRYLRALVSLFVTGREKVVQELFSYNLDLLQTAPEFGVAADKRTAEVPALLELTDAQKDLISAAADTTSILLQQVCQQRQELQLQARRTAAGAAGAAAATPWSSVHWPDPVTTLTPIPEPSQPQSQAQTQAEAQAAGPGCSSVAAAVDQASTAGSTSIPATPQQQGSLAAFDSRLQQLETDSQLLARLKLLMAKEYTLHVTLCGFVFGCLSYKQLSLLSVLAWPYAVRIFGLATGVRSMRLQELQELRWRQRTAQSQQQQPPQQQQQPQQQPQQQQHQVSD